jgi:cell division protein FtsZ
MFELVEEIQQGAKIKVIGVGGAGGNAINTMIHSSLDGVDFVAANTDLQALKANHADGKLQLGRDLTKGLGAGANPEIGKNAALETERELADALMGADMVFVTAGMGGGTGTGAAPVVARVAKECGALTVGVVTKPFAFEGKRRARLADEGINHLRDAVDTLITIPNEKLLTIAGHETTVIDTFKMADEVLLQAVRGIANLITVHGLINLDFADVRSIMSEMGMALMGAGTGSGENRAIDAATKAISSPLLENISIKGATGLLINVTGCSSMTLHEVNEASRLVQEEAHEDANIIFGAVIDDAIEDEVRVTVIATGFNKAVRPSQSARQSREYHEPARRDLPNFERQNDRAASSMEQPAQAEPREWGTLWDSAQHTTSVAASGTSVNTAAEMSSGQLGLQHVDDRPAGATIRQPYARPEVPEPRVSSQELQEVMEEVGVSEQRDDQYDIPTFLRKQAD